MAFYKIDVKKSVFKDINKLNKGDIPQVLRAIEALSKNPRSHQSVKLSGSEHSYRLRARKYRILYQIDDSSKVVTVFAVGHRKDIYK